MRSYLFILLLAFIVVGCFSKPDISAPLFVPKSAPDSLVEKGIDANPDNSIYLEWEEPVNGENEGLLGYYLYRGKLVDQEYNFDKIAQIDIDDDFIFNGNTFIDYDVNLDTLYYYFLRSFNNFTESSVTSDTVFYKLSYPASLFFPYGDVYDSIPQFEFRFPKFAVDNISFFYFRLYYFDSIRYRVKLFGKIHNFDLSKTKYFINLNGGDSHTTVLIDSLWQNGGRKYLEKGDYRWRIDAISSRLGGAPEFEGSESDWMEFTIK
jgi:hypothetical protein